MTRARTLLWRWTRRLAAVGLLLVLIGAAVGAWAYQRWVVLADPGEHLQREAIEAIIAQESPVLYRDRATRIGVFFSQEHREYVPYERIPRAWVDAIVAAEDQRYFDHPGFDAKGIARAMRDNLSAGRVVAGGSTLTQQTAKNLYYRPDRSFRSKWEELVNALRLEAHYSKEEILEFYANQFHVSANGRGLGIAARYFFDEEVEELGILECAYLAGMVKAPATYNPFLGSSPERRELALERAHERTRYVLDRMLADGRLDPAEHARLIGTPIPFHKGTFRYDTHVILDEVAERLEAAPFPALFAELGIDNPSTAGIQVVTTIDQAAQEGATHALWHHLTEVGPLLEAGEETWAGAASFRLSDDRAPSADPHDEPHRWDFRSAVVTAVGEGSLSLDVGGHPCQVDEAAVERAATIVARARKGETWRKAAAGDRAEVLEALPPGAVVWTSFREQDEDGGWRCDLELRPELQGAVLVLEDGAIRAMVGGNDNRNFNRATEARRQLGSTWKPVLYFAALQLGWLPTDVLDNRPGQAFYFEGTWYYPRPDHDSDPYVSLAWAGTRSENLASIWLLAHLTDRLDPAAFEDLAATVNLVPRADEERMAWIRRIRDDYGVISTDSRLPLVAFQAAKGVVGTELEAEGRQREATEVRALLYGAGLDAERARQRGRPERRAWLDHTLLRYRDLAERCEVQAARLSRAMAGGAVPVVDGVADLRLRPAGDHLEVGCGDQGEGWAPVGEHLLAAIAEGVRIPLGSTTTMWIEGRLRRDVLDRLHREQTRRGLVLQQADLWSVEVLQHHPDYRQLVGMRYLAHVARSYGVESDLPPVLSMPLGAVDISLEEVASLYQGMHRGEAWDFPGLRSVPGAVAGLRRTEPVESPDDSTVLIAEIRDRHGNVLYQARPRATALTEPAAGVMAGDILRNVVRWGTGRRAHGTITVAGQPVPVAGKTGTTNSYRNAAFVGFVPRQIEAGGAPAWRWGQGYTLATYVGYDDNRPMRRGGVRLQGASGALPAWLGTARALAEAGLLGEDVVAEAEWIDPEGFVRVPVADGTGLQLEEGGDGGGRSVLVAVERGVFGPTDQPWRVVAPVRPPRILDAAQARAPVPLAAAGEEAVDEVDTADEGAPSEVAPMDEALDGTPDEASDEEPLEEPPSEDEDEDEGEAGSSGEDAVEAWLGDLLDDPAITPAEPGAGEPEVDGGDRGLDDPSIRPGLDDPAAGRDSGIVPRIRPDPPSRD